MNRTTAVAASLAVMFGGLVCRPTAAAEPVSLTVGSEPRILKTESMRGAPLALLVLAPRPAEATLKTVRAHAANTETLAGVRHAVIVGGSADDFAALERALPKEVRAMLYHDTESKAQTTLGVQSQCTSSEKGSCDALVLLDADGKEVARTVGPPSMVAQSWKTLAQKATDLTLNDEVSQANLERGVALAGYDPVAYIEQERAVEGDKKLESRYRGVIYRFASAAHRRAFNADPEKFVPAYGGWCATAIAKGEKVEIDPGNFKVTDGRLFLFYKGIFGNALNDWNKDEKGLTARADQNWKKITAPR